MVKMVTKTEARTFEISKLKNHLEKLWNPPEVTRIVKITGTTPSQFQTWFEIEVSQLRSGTPDVP